MEHPAERFPSVFGPNKSQFWTEYPYMLPCLWAAALCFVTFVLGAAFLNEVCLEYLSQNVERSSFLPKTLEVKSIPVHGHGDYQPLDQDPSVEVDEERGGERPLKVKEPSGPESLPSIRAVFVRPVLAAVLNYGTLAMLDIAYFSIATVFFAVSSSCDQTNDETLNSSRSQSQRAVSTSHLLK